MNLTNKTAVITGGGRGIGKCIALKLASLGANIVINDIPSSPDAEKTVDEINAAGAKAIAISGDVRSLEDMEKVMSGALQTFGSIDILVNNAGITRDTLMMRMKEQDWDDVLDINLKGAFQCIKAVSRIMNKQRSGTIINITSVVGLMGNVGQVNYSASKAGLVGLTKSVAKEFASRGIRCNAVAPGFIQSDMTDQLSDQVKEDYLKGIPLSRFGTAEDIANTVAFLASDASSYITGQVISVNGGLYM